MRSPSILIAFAAATFIAALPQPSTDALASYADEPPPPTVAPKIDPSVRRPADQPAPFLIPQGHEDAVIPNSYIVGLYPNYTLAEHFRFVGQNLTTSDWCEEFDYFSTLGNLYHIVTDNGTLIHNTIRMDPGVEFVEADVQWTVPDAGGSPGDGGWDLGAPEP